MTHLSHMQRNLFLSFFIYLLLTILVTWPVAGQLSSEVAGTAGDDNFQFVWNLWWLVESLVNQQVSPAEVTVLHWPDGGPNPLLGLSVMIPSLAMPTTLLFNPIVSYNLWFLLSFPLAGISAWLLTAYVTKDQRAAFIGGLIFALFPHKTMQGAAHYLQIMVFLFPLYFIALLRLFRRPSLRQAVVTAVTLSLALLVNLVHIGFFLLPVSLLLLCSHLWQERHRFARRRGGGCEGASGRGGEGAKGRMRGGFCLSGRGGKGARGRGGETTTTTTTATATARLQGAPFAISPTQTEADGGRVGEGLPPQSWGGLRGGGRYVGLMLLLTLIFTGPLLIPFVLNSLGGGLTYLQEPGTVRFSADLLALWLPAPLHPLFSQYPAFREVSQFMLEGYPEENVAYLGYTVLLLAILGLWRQRQAAYPWLLVAGVMTILALGPFLKVGGEVIAEGSGALEVDGLRSPILLPYALLMQLPFYEWGRIPNRQLMAAMLALSVLAGLGIASLRPATARVVMIGATLLIVLEFLVASPYPTASAARYELPIWQALRQEARGAVLDLPQWNFFAYPPSNNAMLAQTAHGQPIVGGYIHRLPPGSAETAKAIQEIIVPPAPLDIIPRPAGEEALATLRSLGIATVILHRQERREAYWWTESTWSDADNAAAEAILNDWTGGARWENEELAIYDLPESSPPSVPPNSGGTEGARFPPPQGWGGVGGGAGGEVLWTLKGNWHAAESDGTIARRWLAEGGEVGFWLPAARQASLRIEVQAFAGPRTLTLTLDGDEVLTRAVNEPTFIETPPLDLSAGYHAITLSLAEGCQRPSDINPATGDQRCLGLLVSGVSLVP